jgi:hypothetical protein
MKRLLLIGAVMMLALGAVFTVALADEEGATCTTNPGESALPECFTHADNECYAAGTMDGKCTNDWEWKAGWYIARFNEGSMTREEVPAEFQFLLPPPAPPPVEVVNAPGGTAPSVITICRDYFGNANDSLCLKSDQTGELDFDKDGTINYMVIMIDDAQTCPASPFPAFPNQFNLSPGMRSDTEWGFTPADFAALNAKAYYCWYF